MTTTIQFTFCDDDGDEVARELPAKFEVCRRCEGHGSHLNPSIGEYAYTREEFEDAFDDEQAAEYFRRGGRYDVTCEACGGLRVVPVVDEDACKASPELAAALERYQAKLDDDADYERECAAERRTGA